MIKFLLLQLGYGRMRLAACSALKQHIFPTSRRVREERETGVELLCGLWTGQRINQTIKYLHWHLALLASASIAAKTARG